MERELFLATFPEPVLIRPEPIAFTQVGDIFGEVMTYDSPNMLLLDIDPYTVNAFRAAYDRRSRSPLPSQRLRRLHEPLQDDELGIAANKQTIVLFQKGQDPSKSDYIIDPNEGYYKDFEGFAIGERVVDVKGRPRFAARYLIFRARRKVKTTPIEPQQP